MDPSPRSRRRRTSGLYNRESAAPTDIDLVADIQLEASTGIAHGAAWRTVRDDVHAYAMPVLASLIMKGVVWGLHHQLGGQPANDLRIPVGGVDWEDAHDLAAEAVLGALPILHHQLIAGRWDPNGGASIRTWAVNLSILRLPGPWRAWRKTRLPRLPKRVDQQPDRDHQPEAIVFSIEFERHVELLDDDLLETLVRLDCTGLTDPEIAERVERTVKSVEYRLRTARQAMRRRAAREARLDDRHGVA
jgi:DNA-directed RNA polymerase specialized sigma24 family protein